MKRWKKTAALVLAALTAWLACAPASAAPRRENEPRNLIANPGFEDGADGWSIQGDYTFVTGHNASQSLQASQVQETYLKQTVTFLEAGEYVLRFYLASDGPFAFQNSPYLSLNCDFGPVSFIVYPTEEWQYFEGVFTVPEGYENTTAYLEVQTGRSNLLLDDFLLTPAADLPAPPVMDPGDNIVPNSGFEGSLDGWTHLFDGPGGVSHSPLSHQGEKSLLISPPRDPQNSSIAATTFLPGIPGGMYEISAYVMLPEADAPSVETMIATASDTEFLVSNGISQQTPQDGAWHKLTFRAYLSATDSLLLGLGNYEGKHQYIDDVSIAPLDAVASANLLENPGFELGLAGWTQQGAPCALPTREAVFSGSGAARFTYQAFAPLNNYLSQTVSVAAPGSYTATVWLRPEPGLRGGGGFLLLEVKNAQGVLLRSAASAAVSGPYGQWQKVSVTVAAPAGADRVTVKLGGAYCTGSFTADAATLRG